MTLSTLVVLLLIAAGVVYFGQRSLVYFPSNAVPAPMAVGLDNAEEATFDTEDGLTLGAWFVPACAASSGYTAIVFNGNAGHRGYRAALASGLARAGIAVLLFDYRGYGGNPGLPYEKGIIRDSRAALQYVRAREDVDPRRIVFFGESLGAAVAVQLAAEFAPAALILRSPFSSMRAMARVHLGPAPGWMLRDRYDSISVIDRIGSPLLVIAGDRDGIVPIEDSETLFNRAREPKRLVVIEDADHNDADLTDGPRVIAAIVAWLGR